jgi:hypothetical protein
VVSAAARVDPTGAEDRVFGTLRIVVYILVGPSVSGVRQVAKVTTAKNGTFTLRRRVLKTALLWAYVPIYFPECAVEPALVVGGCLRQTWSPAYATLARIVVPKPKR